MHRTVTRHFTLADQAADRYPKVPFNLPAQVTSFEVSIDVAGGEPTVVDLGCQGPDRWRGWSGGAHRSFVIGQDDASPGYLPGVCPGTWHVVLGLHRVPDEGCSVTVTVRAPADAKPDHGPKEEPVPRRGRGSDRALPAPPGLTWYAGDTHAHSLHSDGALSLWELANEAVASGLDFLCVTEHNTTSHHRYLAEVGKRHDVLLLPGQEVTTHAGHANVFGYAAFIDFRLPAQQWVRDTARQGALMSINHPVSGDCSWLHRLGEEPSGVELYHSTWYEDPASRAALAWFQRWRHDAVVVGGSDFHDRGTPIRPGLPTTWVAAEELSVEGILDGIRAGRTAITASGRYLSPEEARPDHARAPILLRCGRQMLVLAATGLIFADGAGRRVMLDEPAVELPAPRADGPYWLEDETRRVVALTA